MFGITGLAFGLGRRIALDTSGVGHLHLDVNIRMQGNLLL